jgi:hypothetical protein
VGGVGEVRRHRLAADEQWKGRVDTKEQNVEVNMRMQAKKKEGGDWGRVSCDSVV